MTLRKQEQIYLNATLLYRAFPVSQQTVNHSIILKASELIKRVFEYKGNIKALPKELLEMKYNSFWAEINELEKSLERGSTAYTEARKSLNEAEEILNWVFLNA